MPERLPLRAKSGIQSGVPEAASTTPSTRRDGDGALSSSSNHGNVTARVTVGNENLVTVRDAMRGLNRMVDQLAAGEIDKFVLMHHGRMVAAVVPLTEVAEHV